MENISIYIGTIAIFIIQVPIFQWLSRYRQKKFGGEILKYFHGKKQEIDGPVKKALDSLSLDYETLKEGSKWSVIIPYYKILKYDILVKVKSVKSKETYIALRIQNPKDIEKAKEIQQAIDSHIEMLALKT
jgi:hypothetical protein